MRRTRNPLRRVPVVVALALVVLVPPTRVGAQDATSGDAAGLDPVSRRASELEARLGKVVDHSPEGAEILLELVELYHENGRAFGLVRAGQKFINAQPTHPQHEQVMLRLLDGLRVTSRNEDTIATARQFL